MATFSVGTAGAYLSGSGLVLPGNTGCYASTADSGGPSITGDITLVGKIAMTDWTPTNESGVIGKWNTANQRSYLMTVTATGTIRLYTSTDGATTQTITSSAAPSVSNGDTLWIAANIDVDDGAGNNVVKFWTSTDGTTWTQLGSTRTTVGATSIYDGTAVVESGSWNAGASSGTNTNFIGTIYKTRIYAGSGFDTNGPSGTLRYNTEFDSAPAGAAGYTETAGNHPIVIVGSSVPLDNSDFTENYFLIPGLGQSNNYLILPDAADLETALDDFTIILRINSPAWKGVSGTWMNMRYVTNNVVYGFYMSSGGFTLGLSTAGVALTSFATVDNSVLTGGTTYWLRVERRASDGRVQFHYAADQATLPSSWTQIGTDQTAVTGTLFNGSATMYPMGMSNFGTNPMTLKSYRSLFYNGLHSGGSATLLRDVDAAYGSHNIFAEQSVNAALVTVNRATAGAKTQFVTCPSLQFSTAKYLQFADDADFDISATDSFTIAGTFRIWGTPGAIMMLISKRSSGAGWLVQYTTSRTLSFFFSDGTNSVNFASGVLVSGVKNTFVAQRDIANDIARLYINGVLVNITPDTTTATLENTASVAIGASSIPDRYCDMEWLAGPVFYRSAISEAEIMILTDYLNDESGSDSV